MRDFDQNILEVQDGTVLLRDSENVECLTVYMSDGECIFQTHQPHEHFVCQLIQHGLYLIVVNLSGGRYFTNIFRSGQ